MGKFNTPRIITGLVAAVDLSAQQYTYQKQTSNTQCNIGGVGSIGLGFLMNKPTAGISAEIAGVGGGALAISAATIAAGVLVKPDASGHMVAAATANDLAVALTMESSVDGQVFEVQPLLTRVHA